MGSHCVGLAPLLIISPGPPRLALGRGRLWEEVARPRFPESMSLNLALGPLPLVLYFCHLPGSLAPLVAQMVKNLPAIQETWGRPLGREDLQRRKWQPTLVFLPGESHGQRSLAGYRPWGCKESDMTERLTHCFFVRSHKNAEKVFPCSS